MTEFVLYGGKGGVGKTTCAAATGLALAERGHRTLVLSTDPAHSLGDSFQTDLGGDPRQVDDDLWGVEVTPDAGQAAYRRVVEALVAEFRSAGLRIDESDLEELFAAGLVPGSDEVAALEYVAQYATSDEWDRVVLDTAPTGHTLRLLDLPEVLSTTLGAASEVRGQVRRLADSARSMVMGPAAFFGRRPDDADDIAALRGRMDLVADLLCDPERTEFRVVLVPEAMAIEETKRLVDRLGEADVQVTSLVVNKVLDDVDERCDRCRARRDLHRQRVDEIRSTFPDLPIRTLPLLDGEAGGCETLATLARGLGDVE